MSASTWKGGDKRYTRAELSRVSPATVKPSMPHHRELEPWIEATLVGPEKDRLRLKCHHCGKGSEFQAETPELHNMAIQSFVKDHFFRANVKLCRHEDEVHGKDCYCKRRRAPKKKAEQLRIPGT